MRKKKIGIYRITSPTGKIYVGQSKDIDKRFSGYKRLENIKTQIRLCRSLLKHGPENHLFEILEECDIGALNDRERYWQDNFKVCGMNGLNCRLTSSNDKSAIISTETRRKMSESGKRKVMSDKHLDNIRKSSQKRIGIKLRPRTESERERMHKIVMATRRYGKDNNMYGSARFGEKNPFYNKKHTEESIKKMSEKAKGRIPSIEVRKIWSDNNTLGGNPAAKLVMNTESGIFYSCGKEAWIAYGKYTYSTFKSKLNGSNKHPIQFKYV